MLLQKDWVKVNEGSPLQDDKFGMKTPERYSQEEEETTKTDEGKRTSSGEESAEDTVLTTKISFLQRRSCDYCK